MANVISLSFSVTGNHRELALAPNISICFPKPVDASFLIIPQVNSTDSCTCPTFNFTHCNCFTNNCTDIEIGLSRDNVICVTYQDVNSNLNLSLIHIEQIETLHRSNEQPGFMVHIILATYQIVIPGKKEYIHVRNASSLIFLN